MSVLGEISLLVLTVQITVVFFIMGILDGYGKCNNNQCVLKI